MLKYQVVVSSPESAIIRKYFTLSPNRFNEKTIRA